jgi:hypothetical protein
MKNVPEFSDAAPEPTQDTGLTYPDGSQPTTTQQTSASLTARSVSSMMSQYFAAGLDHLVSIKSSEFVIPSETKWKMVKLTDEEAFDSIPQIDRLEDEAILDSLTAYIHWNIEFCEEFFDRKQEFPVGHDPETHEMNKQTYLSFPKIEIFRPRGESYLGSFALLVGNMVGSASLFGGSQGMHLSFAARVNMDRITSQCVCQLNKEGLPYALVTLTPSQDKRKFGENYDGPWVPTQELGIRWKRSARATASFSDEL